MKMFSFPFDKIDRGSSIVLFGCGKMGRHFLMQIMLTQWNNVSCIIDNNFKQDVYFNIPVLDYNSFKIQKGISQKDVFVISISDANTANAIISELISDGVQVQNIVWSNEVGNIDSGILAEVIGSDSICDKEHSRELIDLQMQLFKRNFAITEIPHAITQCDKKELFISYMKMITNDDKYNIFDMTRVVFLMLNAEEVIKNVSGCVAEVGVFRGDTASILSSFCKQYNKKLLLFDTFEGFDDKDLVGIDEDKKGFKDTSLEYVKNAIGTIDHVSFLKGYFPQTFDDICQAEKYCFVHLDCDLYIPIKEGLRCFWPRMNSGGIIMVHDYSSGFWPGTKKAVDEFCKVNNVYAIKVPDLAGSVILYKM